MRMDSAPHLKTTRWIVSFATFTVIFSPTIGNFLPGGEYTKLIGMGLGASAFFIILLLRMFPCRTRSSGLSIYVAYLILLILPYADLAIIRTPPIVALIGFLNLTISLVFWWLAISLNANALEEFFNSVRSIFIAVGFVVTLGAFVQFFVSRTLFGLLGPAVYTSEGVGTMYTQRAISFITSPQSLSIFLGVLFALNITGKKQKTAFVAATSALILFAGLLTGSKSFVLFIGLFAVLFAIDQRRWGFLMVLVGLILLFPVLAAVSETTGRLVGMAERLTNLSDYLTFQIWLSFVTFPSDLIQVLFGHGLGIVSRGAQILYEYSILNGSAESFFVQLYFETGVVGLLIFCVVYGIAIRRIARTKYRFLAYILLALLSNLIGTPAYYGYTISFFVSFLIVFSLLHRASAGKTADAVITPTIRGRGCRASPGLRFLL